VQRAIELVGIPTVVVTVEPEETRQARPPRALSPRGFVAGHSLGRPNDAALQKWILMDALGLLLAEPRPGEVIERDRKGDAAWTRFAFPTWWHYDVLRGLDYLRRAGVAATRPASRRPARRRAGPGCGPSARSRSRW